MLNFNQMKNVVEFETACALIETSGNVIREQSNIWAPIVIEAVLAGDNISHVNKFIGAFKGIQADRVITIVKRFVPFEFDKETNKFTTKNPNAKPVAKKVRNFTDWIESGVTFWELIETKKAADKKPVDHTAALTKACVNGLNDGMTADEIMAIIQAVCTLAAPKDIAA